MENKQYPKIAGFLIFIGLTTGVLSIVPSVESENYLGIVYQNKTEVLIGALFQFLLIPIYIGFTLIFYYLLRQYNSILLIGFIGFRFMAGVFQLLGIILLPVFILLSEKYSTEINSNLIYETAGEILKFSRDLINHLGVIIATGLGNLLLYSILYKEKNIPIWLSLWGITGNVLIMIAGFLILFQLIEVISTEYIIIATPILVQEIILAIWLIKNGLKHTKMSF
ncbi:DUF4386 domain-containing protein [Arenibacter sp. M-2]|uniref:DUF4386 domain-containing protein n=1 Tax=Arenibacter sp. M-2 TaxID=3053612 RepID=UPI0025707C31|nr:DUF4386 domain-containing protein [Arenibacter sp. M-2]MDL5513928.1 DUF4386 domain-containing protein [Arenibacter sp. M-2]|tara:strand:- start:6885 stop:7556 length:672 start_codon:yes stop_codon:yes gene_type:complete